MTSGREHLEHRPLRAPQESGAALVDPPFDHVGQVLRANIERRARYCCDLQGRCLSDLAEDARRELVAEALRCTSAYRDLDGIIADPSGPILLAGHQPQLFHPGVWFKNFALGALGRLHRATAINLVIDSDTMKSNTIRVPAGSATEPVTAAIPLDRAGEPIPFEERRIADREVFADFGRRAAHQIASLAPDPLLVDFWPTVLHRAQSTDNLGACLAQARHQWEGRWGCRTLEVAQSRVCSLPSHYWFAAHLVAQLPRFRAIYNEVVDEYRRVHHIRSTAHPVPDLAADGPWLEAPFWIWTSQDPQRRRLFARARGKEVVLSDRRGLETALPLAPDGDARRAVQRLAELNRGGVKIRSRALVTTLWARLVLGDLFLHGIGGAKYDQVTDALIARFFGLQPPEFMVLSATLRLPVPRAQAQAPGTLGQRLRDLSWHPERHVDPSDGDVAGLVAEKRRWVHAVAPPSAARTRFLEIRRLNQALQSYVAVERERLLDELERAKRAARAETILSWREYAFCLYPESTLRDTFSCLLPR